METATVFLVLVYVAGVIFSILFPYVLAWVETGEKFNVRMNVGRVLVAVAGLLPTLALAGFVEQLTALGCFGSFVLGMGFSQAGRIAQHGGAVAEKTLRSYL